MTALYEKKKFYLTNSMTGKKEEFIPIAPPEVLFYSCGPTVYGPLHIGNARALIFADLMYRWLKHLGYKVNFVRNYTDVDDKIIAQANKEKIEPSQVSEKYIEYCETDARLLGLERPVKTVKVTESMPEIIALIQKIIARGHAYVVGGEVFYSIESFPTYGKLSGKNVDELQAGARIDVDARKRNPLDFSLWKPHKPGEPYWESPWGRGRPGWHIECSAMSSRWLADSIDLHHGGQDLIFPHHENEIAQSEAASGKPFCRYWVHHAFLTKGNEKMSKSLGNILTIREFIERYGAELLKFIYLSFNYRTAVPYTDAMLNQVLGELERIYLAKKWAREALAASAVPGAAGEAVWSALVGKSVETFSKIEDELASDLNTSGAMGHLFSLIRDLNRSETQAAGKPGLAAPSCEARRKVAGEFLKLLETRLGALWGVFLLEPSEVFRQIEAIRRDRRAAQASEGGAPTDEQIRALIEERAQARKNKDFKRGDEIRKELDAQGIILVDGPQGTTWKSKG